MNYLRALSEKVVAIKSSMAPQIPSHDDPFSDANAIDLEDGGDSKAPALVTNLPSIHRHPRTHNEWTAAHQDGSGPRTSTAQPQRFQAPLGPANKTASSPYDSSSNWAALCRNMFLPVLVLLVLFIGILLVYLVVRIIYRLKHK